MRTLAYALLLLLLAVPLARAQEPPAEPTPEQIPDKAPESEPAVAPSPSPAPVVPDSPKPPGKPQWKDWTRAPHITVSANRGESFFVPRFWYRVQDQRVEVRTEVWTGDLRHDRFFLTAQYTSVPGRDDVSGLRYEFRITPWRLGPVRPGFGYWQTESKDASTVFASGGSSVITRSERVAAAAVVELAVGPFDRTHIRFTGLYGNTRVTSDLDLYVNDLPRDSPLGTRSDDNSDFWGVGAEAAVRKWGFSLEGSVTGYRPKWTSIAMPMDCAITNVGASYMTPFKYAHVGVFVRRTTLSKFPAGARSSLQFFNDGWTFGLSARVP